MSTILPERPSESGASVLVQKFAVHDGARSVHYEENNDLRIYARRGGIVQGELPEGAVTVLLGEDGETQDIVMADGPGGGVSSGLVAVERALAALQTVRDQLARMTVDADDDAQARALCGLTNAELHEERKRAFEYGREVGGELRLAGSE